MKFKNSETTEVPDSPFRRRKTHLGQIKTSDLEELKSESDELMPKLEASFAKVLEEFKVIEAEFRRLQSLSPQ